MPLLAEFEVRVGAGGYKHAAPSGAVSASVRSGMFIETDTQGPAPTWRLLGDLALHGVGDSPDRQVGDLPHATSK